MNKERLELMSTMLGEVITGSWKMSNGAKFQGAEVTDIGFNLWVWFRDNSDLETTTCGFSACAVGHAMLDDRFTNQGLKLNDITPIFTDQDYNIWHNWEAVEKFFEIGEVTAESLFMNSYYYDSSTGEPYKEVRPDQVKWRVDKLLELGSEDVFNSLVDESISEIRELYK